MASTTKTFRITVPRKSELCCTICRIVNNENNQHIYADFCSNKLKCRQFLQETPQAMAAPVINRKILEAGGTMHMIVTKELFESCTFQDHCDALNVQVMDLMDPIPLYIYKACLLHTLEYKLAPQWNKVGLFFVEGRGFLSGTGNVNAVTLDLKDIRGDNARLEIKAINLKIPFVRLNTTRPLQHEIQPPVRVLPSMKFANVLDISKTIKDKCPFKDYEQLRTYWRNMHGYVLPDSEEGILFYGIEFFYFKSSALLYPETCLTSGPLQVLPSPMDPLPIIYRFTEELRARVINLCGQQFDIFPEYTYKATVLACTPALPAKRTDRFSTRDKGYGTQSRKDNMASSSGISDICKIPTKRMRLSLSKANDSLTCGNEVDDFNLGTSLTCPANKFQISKNIHNISMISSDVDSAIGNSMILQKNQTKSHYFEKEEGESKNKFLLDPTEEEEKFLSLKQKLLKAKDNK